MSLDCGCCHAQFCPEMQTKLLIQKMLENGEVNDAVMTTRYRPRGCNKEVVITVTKIHHSDVNPLYQASNSLQDFKDRHAYTNPKEAARDEMMRLDLVCM